MKKAVLPLALALLGVSSCNNQPDKKLDVPKTRAATEAAVPKRLGFNIEEVRNRWIVHYDTLGYGGPDLPILQAARLLPISYEYNYKDGRDINGVWCGIEGRTGASLTRKKANGSLDAEILFDIYGPGELPSLWPRHLEGEIPEGYSLIVFTNTGRRTTQREINRILGAYESYVSRYGNKIQLGITREELATLRGAIGELKGNIAK